MDMTNTSAVTSIPPKTTTLLMARHGRLADKWSHESSLYKGDQLQVGNTIKVHDNIYLYIQVHSSLFFLLDEVPADASKHIQRHARHADAAPLRPKSNPRWNGRRTKKQFLTTQIRFLRIHQCMDFQVEDDRIGRSAVSHHQLRSVLQFQIYHHLKVEKTLVLITSKGLDLSLCGQLEINGPSFVTVNQRQMTTTTTRFKDKPTGQSFLQVGPRPFLDAADAG
jgi:hypothetical protein